MDFVQNFPFFSIILSLFAGPVSSVLDAKKAKWLNTFVIVAVGLMSLAVLIYTLGTGEAYVYKMGHFSAPWGNEIRVGVLEGAMALFFCIIMGLSMLGGRAELVQDIEESKQNLYYIMVNLLLTSLLALVYTNDLFTAYVFVEINTISACGLIMLKQTGRTIEAATRYMVMSLLGSGLLLLGICFLYSITGHLLMSNIKEAVQAIYASGQYSVPLLVAICLMSIGLAIKSALFPFHSWLPDAYGYSTLSSQAMLSSLVSKGYLFLLIKIYYRVIGFDIIIADRMINVLFVFGVIGMIAGSVSAIREKDINRMIAYSSVAQIGYIYMGFGLGNEIGMVASIFHILCHAATKSMLFVSAAGLIKVSGGKRDFRSLRGSAHRNKLAGLTFAAGSFSMIGFPIMAGFISKLLFANAGIEVMAASPAKMLITLIALAISTILNAVYFIKTVITIYIPEEKAAAMDGTDPSLFSYVKMNEDAPKSFAMIVFIALNVFMGISSDWIVGLIEQGLKMFS